MALLVEYLDLEGGFPLIIKRGEAVVHPPSNDCAYIQTSLSVAIL